MELVPCRLIIKWSSFCSNAWLSKSVETSSDGHQASNGGMLTTRFASPSNFTFLTGGKKILRLVCGLPLSAENSECERFVPSLGESGAFFNIERNPMGCVYGRDWNVLVNGGFGIAGEGRRGKSELAIVFDVVGVGVPIKTPAEPRTPFEDFVYGDGSEEVCRDNLGRPLAVIVAMFLVPISGIAPLCAAAVLCFVSCEEMESP